MAEYKTYPTYKDSGSVYLGDIPAHWDNIALNYLFKENKEKNKGNIEKNILSLSYGKVISKKGEENYGLLPASFETYQIIKEGYLIFRFTDLQNDHKSLRVGYSSLNGIITSAYLGLKPGNQQVFSKFYYYLFHSLDIKKYFYGFGGGVRLSLDWNTIRKIKYPLPSLSEQTAIANFLDRKTAEIASFIALKEKTIALLKERKTAIINKAVTKGLDDTVPIKDSGIGWLGEIPAHWEVKKLKYLFRITKRIVGKLGFDVLSITQKGIKIKDITSGEGQLSMDYSKYQLIEPGDFGMNHMDLITGYVDKPISRPFCKIFTGFVYQFSILHINWFRI